jgi:ATPase subunit of ABC transporter with duplicated ATPase domains
MGRNGCGKTTFMTFLAQRQIENAVPKKMSMLLVRQEIIGCDLSAVDTVIKSDVKREGVKRFIKFCEEEIERLENGGQKSDEEDNNNEESKDDSGEGTKVKGSSKGRQKLVEKKKARLEKAARAKAKNNLTASKMKEDNIETKKTKLSEKLGKAYQKLAEIEEEEGGDPEPRARKVLFGMGFSEEMQNKPTSELSGGWRMRVSISCALFASPSLLL